MPEKVAEQTNVNMTTEQFQNLMEAMITASRKPLHDPIKEKQVKRMKEHNAQGIADQRQMKIAKFQNCSHMQRPGSILTGCSAVAWATQSDGKVRGFCQHCGTMFSPVKEECLSPEIHEAYRLLLRIPTHPAGDLNYTFQHA